MLNYEMEVPEPFFGTAALFFFVCFVAVVIADPANLDDQLWSACSIMECMFKYGVHAQLWRVNAQL